MAKQTKPQPEEVQLTEPGPVETNLYTVGQWSGLPQYVCKICGFDAMREAAMRDHIKLVHFPEPPLEEPGKILVADKRGNPVALADDPSLIGVYEIDLEEVMNDATNDLD